MTTNPITPESSNGGCLDEREAFETDYLRRFNAPGYLGRTRTGAYEHLITQARWESWQARASLSTSKQAGVEPVAEVVWLEADDHGTWPKKDGRKDVDYSQAWIDSVPLGTKLYVSAPAAIPAAPSEVTDAQIERMTNLAFAATNDRGEMGLQKYWYGKGVREGASLTQPTTVQQADEAQIEAAARVIAQCMDYPWEHMPEQGRNNMREHAKAVAAVLLAAQTTALPGADTIEPWMEKEAKYEAQMRETHAALLPDLTDNTSLETGEGDARG